MKLSPMTLSTVISFEYKDKWWFDESMSVTFYVENTLKRILLFPLPEKNENHYSKENNTSENPIPRPEIFKLVHCVKYEGQVRSQHLLFAQFSR